KLKTLSCREAAQLPPCATERCLRVACHEGGPIRLDELEAEVGGEKVRLITAAAPVDLPGGAKGALIVLRNVTDDARVQERYQKMVEEAEALRRDLAERLSLRTRDLLAANAELNRLEKEIGRLKRGGV